MISDTANAGAGTETVSQETATSNTEAQPIGNGDWAAGLPGSEADNPKQNQSNQASDEGKIDGVSDGILPDKKTDETTKSDELGKKDVIEGEDKPLDITLPEGFQRDEAKMKWLNDFAKEAKLGKESAQKAMDFYCQAMQEQHKGFQEHIHELRAKIDREGNEAIHADPEIGGENFDASATYAEKAIRRFMGQKGEYGAIKQLYHDANLRNNPLIFKMLARVGKYISEADPLSGDAGSKERQSTADMFFPDLKGK